MKISFKSHGDLKKTSEYFKKAKEIAKHIDFDKYGQAGVDALQAATPRDTGLTASSWYYQIRKNRGNISIEFYNSNVNQGVPIAIILQYGHGTLGGGYVAGRDYINPAIRHVFDDLANNAWKEVME